MQRIRWWSAGVLSAAVGIAGCGGQDNTSADGSLALSHEQGQQQGSFTKLPPNDKIFAFQTGAEIDWVPLNNAANAQHYVWLPAARKAKKRLFVFMPGTGNKPVDYQYFSGEAARAGYHVIGLMYRNDKAIESVCPENRDPSKPPRAMSPDEDCSGKMRLAGMAGHYRCCSQQQAPRHAAEARHERKVEAMPAAGARRRRCCGASLSSWTRRHLLPSKR